MKSILFAGKIENSILSQDIFSITQDYDKASKQAMDLIENMGDLRPLCVVEKGKMEQWGGLFSQYGLRFGKDYVDEYTAIRRYGQPHKKLAVFYGNCQVHDYYDCLNMSGAFNSEYDSVYFKYLEYPRWKEDFLEGLLDICDLLIMSNECFDEKFRNCDKYVRKNNAAAKVIHITTYSFRGYFPQTNPHIQAKGEFDIINEYFNTFHREDTFVNDMIKHGLSCEEIIERVTSGNSFSPESVKRSLDIALKQLEVMDRKSDITIADYVRDNYRKRRLFKDPVHMENELVWYVANRLLELLGIEVNARIPEKEIHYFTELPIYPEVKSALGLEWVDENTHYRVRMQEGMIGLDTAQFYERYYELARNAYEIKGSLEIDRNADRVEEWFPGYEN